MRVTVPTYITLNTALSTAGWEDQGNGLFVFTTGTFQIGDTGAVSLVVNVPLVSQGATIPLTARFVDNGSQGRDLNPDDNVVRIFSIIENADAERWV